MPRKQRKKERKRKKGKTARSADRYELYQKAVQEPEADVPLVNRVYRKHFKRNPRKLREDFCGTALFACQWVKTHPENEAVGIDLDPEPLEWGRKHNVSELTPEQAARIKLVEGDVNDVAAGDMDVTVAFNFSYFIFKERAQLLRYFRRAKSTLSDEGLLFLDIYGGPDAQRTLTEKRKVGGFHYVWDQHVYDPIQSHGVNYIHFEFKDGTRMRRAFRYDWRIWGLTELRDLLSEAGFSKTEVYWEGTDSDTGDGNGIFYLREKAEDDPAWICYLVAIP